MTSLRGERAEEGPNGEGGGMLMRRVCVLIGAMTLTSLTSSLMISFLSSFSDSSGIVTMTEASVSWDVSVAVLVELFVEAKDSVLGVDVKAGFSGINGLGNNVAEAGGLSPGDFLAKKSRYAGGGVSGVFIPPRGKSLMTVGEAMSGLAISEGKVPDFGVSRVGSGGRIAVVAMMDNC
jgi:hypothetical protein